MKLGNLYPIRSKAVVYQSEIDYISKCVLDFPDIETGGDLFGFWTHSGFPVVQYVIGPGRNANHQIAFFNQDIDYLTHIGNALRNTHALQHIGEWHSHHKLGLAEPSSHDITTITNAINNYNLQKFFLVITNVRQNSTTINGFMFAELLGRNFDYSGWVILSGNSPIRQSFDNHFPELVYRPATQAPSIINLTTVSLEGRNYVKPEYSSQDWLSDKANHVTMKSILEGLSKSFQDVKIYQHNENKSIFIQYQYRERTFMTSLPPDFPLSKPIITEITSSLERRLESNTVNWVPNEDISEFTINYIISVIGLMTNS